MKKIALLLVSAVVAVLVSVVNVGEARATVTVTMSDAQTTYAPTSSATDVFVADMADYLNGATLNEGSAVNIQAVCSVTNGTSIKTIRRFGVLKMGSGGNLVVTGQELLGSAIGDSTWLLVGAISFTVTGGQGFTISASGISGGVMWGCGIDITLIRYIY